MIALVTKLSSTTVSECFGNLQGLIPGGALKPIDVSVDANFDVTEHYWFPMLAGLSDLTSDLRPEVRSCALEVLFDLLNERGSKFSSSFWESIFHRVLFPIFDHVRHAGKESLISSDDELFRETSIHSLQLLCNLFNTFYKVLIVCSFSLFFLIVCIWTIASINIFGKELFYFKAILLNLMMPHPLKAL